MSCTDKRTKLIFIYGPPAAGKLTVAKVLSEITGLTLFHNHLVHEMLKVLFPFTDTELTQVRSHLARKFRAEIIERQRRLELVSLLHLVRPKENTMTFFVPLKNRSKNMMGK